MKTEKISNFKEKVDYLSLNSSKTPIDESKNRCNVFLSFDQLSKKLNKKKRNDEDDELVVLEDDILNHYKDDLSECEYNDLELE